VVHTQGVRPGAGQIIISYQLFVESPPTPPTEEPTVTPTEEPTAPPTEEPTVTPTEEPTVPPTEEPTTAPVTEQPTTTEPTVPNLPEPESVNPAPSESEQKVTAQPEPSQVPSPGPADLGAVLAPEPVEELTAPIIAGVIPNQPQGNNFKETRPATDDLVSAPDPIEQDEILQQPTTLRQAAQKVVVPVQNKQTPWSSDSLFAGLIGLGIFALIAGLVVARRGVPGAIAS
jgi:hypothetical protein